MEHTARPTAEPRDADRDLRADCSACVGLCCVEPAFAAGTDFAFAKPARTPCPNLLADCRCSIHDALPEAGFPGCTTFDCFGAGQRLTHRFGDRDWRSDAATATAMFDAFPSLRALSEMVWHLREACRLAPTPTLAERARRMRDDLERLLDAPSADGASVDVDALRRRVGPLLEEVSTAVRTAIPNLGRDRRGADLLGADLRGARLRGVSLRGALLIGADLSGADLTFADLLGADLRGADLRGAALREALFLTQPQIDAARGNGRTSLPARLRRPRRWAVR